MPDVQSDTSAAVARAGDGVTRQQVEQLGRGGVEPERALHGDAVQDDAQELADLLRRDVRAHPSFGLRRLDPPAAALPCVVRRDRLPSLAELLVRPQASAELEVHGEPVGIVPEERVEDRLEALLCEEVQEARVVARGEGDEQLLLGREPVEDRAARHADLLLQPDDGRALVAVLREAPAGTVEDTLAALDLVLLAQLRHRLGVLYKTVRTSYITPP